MLQDLTREHKTYEEYTDADKSQQIINNLQVIKREPEKNVQLLKKIKKTSEKKLA